MKIPIIGKMGECIGHVELRDDIAENLGSRLKMEAMSDEIASKLLIVSAVDQRGLIREMLLILEYRGARKLIAVE